MREYAKWLGMELKDDLDLFWIAKEGLKAPLPENWKPCKTVDTDEIYYFNFATGEPCCIHTTNTSSRERCAPDFLDRINSAIRIRYTFM